MVYSAGQQDHQQQTQQLQDLISKLQQEIQKLKPLESQLLQAQQQQQQGAQQQQRGRESVDMDEGGSSNTLKIPSSGSRTGGKLFKKRVSPLHAF